MAHGPGLETVVNTRQSSFMTCRDSAGAGLSGSFDVALCDSYAYGGNRWQKGPDR